MKTPNPLDRYDADAKRHSRRYQPPSAKIPWIWLALILTVGVMASGPVTTKIKGAVIDAQTRHSLAVLAANFPTDELIQQQTGTISAVNANLSSGVATSGSSVQWTLPAAASASTIGVQGTYSATLIVQISTDGSNWITIPNTSYTKVSDGSTGAISGSSIWTVPTSGAYARVTCSAFTSGSAVVTGIPYSAGSAAGGGSGGSVTQGTNPWVTQPNNNMTGVAPGTAPGFTGIIGAIYNSTPPTLTNGQGAALQLDASGTLRVDVVTTGAGLALDSSLSTANTTLSSMLTALQTNGLKDSGGTEMTRTGPHSLSVTTVADTSGGGTPWNNSGAAVTTAVNVTSGAANLYKANAINVSTTTGYYMEFFNVDAASVTLGVTVPVWVTPVPTSSTAPNAVFDPLPMPISFSTKISVAVVTAIYGNTAAPSATVYPQIEVK